MFKGNFNSSISKKAYEIGYAIFRVTSSLKERSLADRLQNQAVLLLESTITKDYPKAQLAVEVIDCILRFGVDVNLINSANVELISGELTALNSAIAGFASGELVESGNAAKPQPIDIDNIFTRAPVPLSGTVLGSAPRNAVKREAAAVRPRSFTKAPSISNNNEIQQEQTKKTSLNEAKSEIMTLSPTANDSNRQGLIKAVMRQSAILERIRQNNNLADGKAGCRLREFQELFPESSERTLRYDIESLIEQGLIERVGNSGPATYYRAKTELAAKSLSNGPALSLPNGPALSPSNG